MIDESIFITGVLFVGFITGFVIGFQSRWIVELTKGMAKKLFAFPKLNAEVEDGN